MAVDVREVGRKGANAPSRKMFRVADEMGSDIAEDMFQALADAPLPLQVGTLYEEWHRSVRGPILRKAATYRREQRGGA